MNFKKSILVITFSLLLALVLFSTSVFSCTTIVVGKDACVDGCPMIGYCCDGARYDTRVIKVPAKQHELGEMRPLYSKPPENIRYPRIVDPERSPGYAPIEGQKYTKPVAYIPEVEYTNGYFELVMPMLNDNRLAMGECTCGVRTRKTGGDREDAPFENRNLARIAMERCSTARDAIKVMGEMAEKYSYNEDGETITIIDTEEAWVFDVLCTPSGKGAIWVAQRVPDDEVAVCANRFTIREIDLGNPDYFMASDNISKIAKAQGWWDPAEGPFDFARAYNRPRSSIPYGNLRRRWRVHDVLAPSQNYSPWIEDQYTKEYPFSFKPDKKVSVQDIMFLYRDHYEGTEFDLTKGLAAGPFGSPNRCSGGTRQGDEKVEGSWERAIGVNRVSHHIVVQSRGWLPAPIGGICWFAHDTAATSCYVPFYAGITKMPEPYTIGSLTNFTRDSSWWAFDFVGNWADLKYSYMIKDINEAQERLEGKAFAMQPAVEKAALALYEIDPSLANEYLTNYSTEHANYVVSEWWKLADYLIMKYNDGYVNIPRVSQGVGYPAWWLKEVGYGPIQKP